MNKPTAIVHPFCIRPIPPMDEDDVDLLRIQLRIMEIQSQQPAIPLAAPQPTLNYIVDDDDDL